jgi:hypothetical protein
VLSGPTRAHNQSPIPFPTTGIRSGGISPGQITSGVADKSSLGWTGSQYSPPRNSPTATSSNHSAQSADNVSANLSAIALDHPDDGLAER